MRPRGFWSTFVVLAVITGVGFGVLIYLLFSLWLSIKPESTYFETVRRMAPWAGVAFGLIFGFAMAFRQQAKKVTLPFQDKEAFRARLDTAMKAMGYRPESEGGQSLTYKPSVRAGILSPRMMVQIEEGSATIVGPNDRVGQLLKKMQ